MGQDNGTISTIVSLDHVPNTCNMYLLHVLFAQSVPQPPAHLEDALQVGHEGHLLV